MKYLVIVESPTKAKTIKNILGKEYDVASSKGHIIDLAPNKLSVDIEKGFIPHYRVITGREKILEELKKKVKKKRAVFLATDPDREGEAISWHIKNRLVEKNNHRDFYRVIFHEITTDAVKEAFSNPTDIDINKVNAQQARRILDRIVGYYLSPLLWRKVSRGLSAGRVQSVALKFIVKRERDIQSFIPKITYGIEGIFRVKNGEFKARLHRFQGQKVPFERKEEVEDVLKQIKNDKFVVKSVSRQESKQKPNSPFTTSLLQQEAFNRFHFSSQRTMSIAQRLYEGIEIPSKGMVGLITYMRTDSVRISDKAKKAIKQFIKANYGEKFLSRKEYKYKEKKSAQLAHEAIRPTDVNLRPQDLKQILSTDEYKLYDLIWRRTVASFMAEAIFEKTKIIISSDKAEFIAEGKRLVFEGFLRLLNKGNDILLPQMEEKEVVNVDKLEIKEHKTTPPARFTDASLVKMMEDKGIGRPSTYAPTISTLIRRNYVRREKGYLIPTDLAFKICDILVKYFPEIMDENFTASMEEMLDEVEEGKIVWKKILGDFYPRFKEKIDFAERVLKKELELVDKNCPQCGRPLAIKWSRRGRFLSCSGYPQCKYAESITTDIVCPQCKEGKLLERRNKRGQRFFGCTMYPKCTYTTRKLPR